MNPLLTDAVIGEALASDRVRMSAEYLNMWREDISDYIPVELLEACTDLGHLRAAAGAVACHYTAHVDIATGWATARRH